MPRYTYRQVNDNTSPIGVSFQVLNKRDLLIATCLLESDARFICKRLNLCDELEEAIKE